MVARQAAPWGRRGRDKLNRWQKRIQCSPLHSRPPLFWKYSQAHFSLGHWGLAAIRCSTIPPSRMKLFSPRDPSPCCLWKKCKTLERLRDLHGWWPQRTPTELWELRGKLQSHKGDKNLQTFTSVILVGGQAEDGTVSKLKLQIHKNIHKRDKNKNKIDKWKNI